MDNSEFSFDEVVAELRRGDVVRWLHKLSAVVAFLRDVEMDETASQLNVLTGELYSMIEAPKRD